jgi:transcriptional antiterminator RfaH
MPDRARATRFSDPAPTAPAWFCLRSHPKHEHIAAAHLRRDPIVEVFLPRIRFRRATRQGGVWVTEALFPNYLFARFDWHDCLRRVQHAPGVQRVVHFGARWPTIPEEVIAELRGHIGEQEVHSIPEELRPGEAVRIVGGAMHGLLAVVSHPLPARRRVAVLLDFLGRQTCVELTTDAVVREADPRRTI